MDLRVGLDDVEKRPYKDSNFNPSAVEPVASRYPGSRIRDKQRKIKNVERTNLKLKSTEVLKQVAMFRCKPGTMTELNEVTTNLRGWGGRK
jgi:hypothetical protein